MKTVKVMLVAILLIAMLSLCACGNAAKQTEFDFGTDKIPTVRGVLGEERSINGIKTGIDNGVQYTEYSYQSDTAMNDLAVYLQALRDNGWLVIQSYNLTQVPGTAQLAKESADNGKILIVAIAFETGKYTVRANKLEGELTKDEQKEKADGQ